MCWCVGLPIGTKLTRRLDFSLEQSSQGYSFNELGIFFWEIKNKIVKREQIMEDGIKHYIVHTTLVAYMFFIILEGCNALHLAKRSNRKDQT
jgi:hypothetical protein